MITTCPRILMFAPSCYPPNGPEAIVTAKLLLAVIDNGWKIDVITQSDFDCYFPASSDSIWQPLVTVIHEIDGFRKGALLRKIHSWLNVRALVHNRSILWAFKAALTGWQLTRRQKYDFILSRVTPQYGHLPALILSRLLNIPWIANWSDPMPSCKAPPPYGQGSSAPIPFYFSNYYSGIIQNANWHTFPCERLRKYVCTYFPQFTDKSSVIPHIALEHFRAEAKNEKVDFTLCHAGGLGIRKPDIFLRGVSLFLGKIKNHSNLKVRFIGGAQDNINDIAKTLGIDKIVSVEEPRTYEETLKTIADAAVLVVIEARCHEGIFFPSKFVDYVQTGRPILAISPKIGTLSDILSTYGGGIAVDNTSADAVADTLGNLYSAWKAGTLEDRYSSSNLFHLFSKETVIGEYQQIFNIIRARVND